MIRHKSSILKKHTQIIKNKNANRITPISISFSTPDGNRTHIVGTGIRYSIH